MTSALLPKVPTPGFSFENFHRNDMLIEKGIKPPKLFSTGTTIAGVIYDGGVVLGADQRATTGSIVAEKACKKIHSIASNIVFCGAGTAGDCDALEKMIKSQLEIHRLSSGKEVPICVATTKICQHLFRYQGYLGCALILGGIDKNGPHLFHIYPHGSLTNIMFASMGSGSLAAMSFLESNYKQGMNLEEAKRLVRSAILAGIENDLGSGNGIDLCVIEPGKMDYIRNYEIPAAAIAAKKQGVYKFKRGTTPLLSTKTIKIQIEEEIVKTGGSEPMEI